MWSSGLYTLYCGLSQKSAAVSGILVITVISTCYEESLSPTEHPIPETARNLSPQSGFEPAFDTSSFSRHTPRTKAWNYPARVRCRGGDFILTHGKGAAVLMSGNDKSSSEGLAGELEGAGRYPQMLASLRLLGTAQGQA